MADEKISAMPAAGALTGNEVVPLVQGGNNVKSLLSAILTFFAGAPGAIGGTTPNTGAFTTVTASGGVTVGTGVLIASSVALTNGAGSGAGTLTNAPAAGNPTKWIEINDNGTIRKIPAW